MIRRWINSYLTSKNTIVSSLATLPNVISLTYFNSRQGFAGVSAGGSKNASRWSSFALIAKSHATLLWLLRHHQLWLFQEALQKFCSRLLRMKTLGCYRCLSTSLTFVASQGMHWCHTISLRGWGLVKAVWILWKEICKLNFCTSQYKSCSRWLLLRVLSGF